MKDLTHNTEATSLTEEYFNNKLKAEQLTELNKEILIEITRLSEGEPAVIGNRKLTFISRKGAVSYASVVKQLLPEVNLEPYRGPETNYYQLK